MLNDIVDELPEYRKRVGPDFSTEISKTLGFHFNGTLWSNLEYYRNMTIHHDADCVGIIDGDEGTGKSVLAQQVAKALDVDHDIRPEQIVFKATQFNAVIRNLKKGKAIIYDESQEGLDRRNWQKSGEITHMLRVCRQRNLFLIMVAQSFYDMDFRVAVRRSRFLLHVYWQPDYEKKVFVRGHYRFYSQEQKKRLYCSNETKKFYDYPARYQNFMGSFSNVYAVDEQEYRKRKAEADFGPNSPDADAATIGTGIVSPSLSTSELRKWRRKEFLTFLWNLKRHAATKGHTLRKYGDLLTQMSLYLELSLRTLEDALQKFDERLTQAQAVAASATPHAQADYLIEEMEGEATKDAVEEEEPSLLVKSPRKRAALPRGEGGVPLDDANPIKSFRKSAEELEE